MWISCRIFKRAECAREWTLTWPRDERRRSEEASPHRPKDQVNCWWHQEHISSAESPRRGKFRIWARAFVLRHMTVTSHDRSPKSDDEQRSCWSLWFWSMSGMDLVTQLYILPHWSLSSFLTVTEKFPVTIATKEMCFPLGPPRWPSG